MKLRVNLDPEAAQAQPLRRVISEGFLAASSAAVTAAEAPDDTTERDGEDAGEAAGARRDQTGPFPGRPAAAGSPTPVPPTMGATHDLHVESRQPVRHFQQLLHRLQDMSSEGPGQPPDVLHALPGLRNQLHQLQLLHLVCLCRGSTPPGRRRPHGHISCTQGVLMGHPGIPEAQRMPGAVPLLSHSVVDLWILLGQVDEHLDREIFNLFEVLSQELTELFQGPGIVRCHRLLESWHDDSEDLFRVIRNMIFHHVDHLLSKPLNIDLRSLQHLSGLVTDPVKSLPLLLQHLLTVIVIVGNHPD
mmetsp:Transcript_50644/g.114917  ORF Transcript_50644/g.114917 Transcript_50644/m.114917 type:complete len:303 (+) Transcript_50644:809-1717(+)